MSIIRIIRILRNLNLYILILICFAHCTHAIDTMNLFEGFENGLNNNIWKTDGLWTIPNNGDYFDGKQSIKSELIGKQASNLSNSIEIWGPCNITFAWKISKGHNQLSFYDNNTSTGYELPSYEFSHCQHSLENWTIVNYNLSDYSKHNLRWMHKNPFDVGTAWIDMVTITYTLAPKFDHPNVEPKRAILIRETSNNLNNVDMIAPRFNYSIYSSSNNVVLYIKEPHYGVDVAPRMYLPTNTTLNTSNGLNKFSWENIKLESNDIGLATHWFIADNYYKTQELLGPEILLFIDDSGSIRKNATNECTLDDYFIRIKGRIDARVTLWFLYQDKVWRHYNDTKLYNSSNISESIYWNNIVSCIENHPDEWKFRIEW
jgi:hypothetical protein